MRRIHRCALFVIIMTTAAIYVTGQTTLSPNSGINAGDTYVIFDMTIHSQGIYSAPDPAASSLTVSSIPPSGPPSPSQSAKADAGDPGMIDMPVDDPPPPPAPTPEPITPLSTVNLIQPDRTYHIEAGYDLSGQIVLNMWPKGPAPHTPGTINLLRFAHGQTTVFDQNGVPIPIVSPAANLQLPQLLQVLRANPGSSISNGLVVSNLQAFSQATSATIINNSAPSTVTLSRPLRAGKGGTVSWTFQSLGGVWVASQIATSPQSDNGNASRVTTFANVVWNVNSANDAARLAQARSLTHPPLPSTTTPNSLPVAATNAAASDSTCGTTITSGIGQNVVFQHGIASNSCTWSRMINWLNQEFQFGTVITPSLPSFSALASQGAALAQQVQSAGGSDYILIGHSQGGLVSRSAAQYLQVASPSAIKGVITVDTPNAGALIAQHGYQYLQDGVQKLANVLWNDTGCVSEFDNVGCFLAALTFDLAPDAAVFGLNSALPATGDNVPGSPFLTNLNSQPENFVRVGIIGNSQQRWLLPRLLADGFNGQPDGPGGGRNVAIYVEIFYDLELADLALAEFNALFDCDLFGDPYACDFDISEADFDVTILHGMDAIDSFWDNLVANPGDGSDGFIQSSSQLYSGAINYPIDDADSHLGATKSDKVNAALTQALDRQFMTPRLGQDFSVSITPASQGIMAGGTVSYAINVSPIGGFQGTVTLSASGLPAGAPITAVFNPVSISGGSGSSTMTITANSLSSSRLSFSVNGISSGLQHSVNAELVEIFCMCVGNPPGSDQP